MSVVNISNLLVQLNQKINSTSDDKEILILVKALEKLKTGIVFTVPTFANLPDASENVGKLYFVENDGILYFSVVSTYNNIEYWVPIIQLSINTLWTWGISSFGELGNGTAANRCSPGTVAGGGTNWCQVSSGSNHAIAIKTDGTIWTWGRNTYASLGDGTTLNRSSPGTIAGGGTTWCQVSAAANIVTALKTDGTIWTWGRNLAGALGDGTTLNRCSPGTVAGGGTNWCQVSGLRAIKTDGTLWTWGFNTQGQLGDGTVVSRSSPGTVFGGGTNWCLVSGGGSRVFGIKTDGTLWTWGSNGCGILGDGTTVSRCSPGTIAGGGTTWCQASGGNVHSVAIKTDGTLWTWGSNSCGQLGDGTTVSRCSPGTIAGGGTDWCRASNGVCHVSALKTDGTLWTWGRNTYGNLGNGIVAERCSPGTVAGAGTNWYLVDNVDLLSNTSIAIQRETL